ncbi:MAG: response regulator [Deltaproteobacteria bacterium]|nr:response regulator [Deltaproteobacteria bacterium]
MMNFDKTKALPPIRIVLVEDNEHDRTAFCRTFQSSGIDCKITEYVRGEEALDAIRGNSPAFDIAVIDHGLPGMSGLELCKQLLAEQTFLPMLILTGKGSEQLAVEALKAGVDDYMIKDPEQHYLDFLPIVIPAVLQKHADRIACKKAEEALARAYDELEVRVEKRTAELAKTTEQLMLELDKRKCAEEEVRHLSRQLISATEEEKKRIARDLHDECGQVLTALHLGVESLYDSLPGGLTNQQGKCNELIGLIEELGDKARHISSELRPDMLDDLGLVPTLESYIEDFSERTGDLQINFRATGVKKRSGPEIEIVLYRILQEALNNIAKHAKAKHVSVLMTYSHPMLIFTIEDDGIGFWQRECSLSFPRKQQGIGLLGMRERVGSVGGSIDIRSDRGKGTFIRIEIPICPDKAGD